MKQLKFMLAAAAAFGIAAAAQADTQDTQIVNQPVDSENFEKWVNPANGLLETIPDGTAATNLVGFSYSGEVSTDNDSVVKAGGYNGSDNALQVNTGTDPILRKLDTVNDAAVNLVGDKFKELYIDTMVQFTVTPAGDPVTAGEEDKLMIYLKEFTNEVAGVITYSTNLVVKAAAYEEGSFVVGGREYIIEGLAGNIVPNAWYRLVVKARAASLGEGYGKVPVFKVFINGDDENYKFETTEQSGFEDLWPDCEGIDFTSEFLALVVNSEDGYNVSAEDGTPAELLVSSVGFAGEGKVDDIVISKDVEQQTSVDFTFTLELGDGVSAVQWTINDTEKDGEDSFSAPAGTTLNVAIKSVTYAAGYAGTEDWTAWTYNAAASGSIEITAEKFADVAVDGTVTPTKGTVDAVTEGAFKVPEATADNAEAVAEAKADLAKALTWASSKAGKSYQSAIAAIKGMTFDEDGDPSGTGDAKTNAEAYLLDCAANQTAIDKAMEDFVLTGFSIGADGAMTFGVGEAAKGDGIAYANGKIEIRGKAALNAANWVKDCPDAAFFKAFLVK